MLLATPSGVYNRKGFPFKNACNGMTIPRIRPVFWASVLFLLAATGVINAQNSNSPAKSSSPEESASAVKQPLTTAAGAAVDTTSYKVGPQDVLKIFVWREPDFSGMYTVHSDGKITLPLVGDLQAGGLTAEKIQDELTQALGKLIVKPNVTVTVQQVLSKKYYMDGMIARSGEYSLAAPITVLEAISIAGGLQDFANKKKIYVLRGNERIRFNYNDVIKGKNLDQNIYLKPGDHVVVP